MSFQSRSFSHHSGRRLRPASRMESCGNVEYDDEILGVRANEVIHMR